MMWPFGFVAGYCYPIILVLLILMQLLMLLRPGTFPLVLLVVLRRLLLKARNLRRGRIVVVSWITDRLHFDILFISLVRSARLGHNGIHCV
jgi:hypothetical protein